MLSSRIGCYHQNQQRTCTKVKPTQWSVGNGKTEVKESEEKGGEKNVFHISYIHQFCYPKMLSCLYAGLYFLFIRR